MRSYRMTKLGAAAGAARPLPLKQLRAPAARAVQRGSPPCLCGQVRFSSIITGGGSGGSGGAAGGKPFACPRCAVPLTKFWQQDQPLWGCVDCREIYSQRDSGGLASRLPRSWSRAAATTSEPAAETATGGEGGARFELGHLPPPAAIKAELDKYVIGQDDVKRALAVAMYNHYKRVRISGHAEAAPPAAAPPAAPPAAAAGAADATAPWADLAGAEQAAAGGGAAAGMFEASGGPTGCGEGLAAEWEGAEPLVGLERGEGEGLEMDKSNIMLVGPTGSGKTLLARTLARLVDVPFTIADATSLTQAGYVGEDVESVLHKLYVASGQNVEATQLGIVYLDEVDKVWRLFPDHRSETKP